MGIKVLQMTDAVKAQEFADRAKLFSDWHKGVDGITDEVTQIGDVYYVRFDEDMDLSEFDGFFMDMILDKKPQEKALDDSVEDARRKEEAGRELVTLMLGQIRILQGSGSGFDIPAGVALTKLLGWTRAFLKLGMFPEAYYEFRDQAQGSIDPVLAGQLAYQLKQYGVEAGFTSAIFDEVDSLIDGV